VPRALRVLEEQRSQAADPQAVETLSAYLSARVEWISTYRQRRRQRSYIGNGLGEKANDRSVTWRQNRRGMQWGEQTSNGLATLRTVALNEGEEEHWQQRQLIALHAA